MKSLPLEGTGIALCSVCLVFVCHSISVYLYVNKGSFCPNVFLACVTCLSPLSLPSFTYMGSDCSTIQTFCINVKIVQLSTEYTVLIYISSSRTKRVHFKTCIVLKKEKSGVGFRVGWRVSEILKQGRFLIWSLTLSGPVCSS